VTARAVRRRNCSAQAEAAQKHRHSHPCQHFSPLPFSVRIVPLTKYRRRSFGLPSRKRQTWLIVTAFCCRRVTGRQPDLVILTSSADFAEQVLPSGRPGLAADRRRPTGAGLPDRGEMDRVQS
jgi:hypothetical protein